MILKILFQYFNSRTFFRLLMTIFAVDFYEDYNMKHFFLSFIIFFSFEFAFSDTLSLHRPVFSPPLNIPLILSGNFSEIRANHFHSGVDIKTAHRVGLPVFAMSDGYVSRVRVTSGSGYMLDIAYKHGISSTYRHLDGFIASIAERTKQEQYKKQSWEVDYTLSPNDFPVKAGEQVAWSGNSGFSAGPHLHLDMYRTVSKNYFDPLPLLQRYIKDHKAPLALSLMISPVEGAGALNGTSRPHIFGFGSQINAWGKIGIAVKAYDYMDDTWQCMGVRYVYLLQDGKLIFSTDMSEYAPSETKMVNSWAANRFMKSYIEPGNTLSMLKAYNGDRGLVTINEERDYHFQYLLKDVYGNTSNYHFVIHGKRQDIQPPKTHSPYLLEWDKSNYFMKPGMMLIVPRGMLCDDVYPNFKMICTPTDISYRYQLSNPPIPLNGLCEIKIALRRRPTADMNKYYIIKYLGKTTISTGNRRIENNCVVSQIKDLSTYAVAVDTTPPRIIPINQGSWNRGRLVFSIMDSQSGIKNYHGYIDGQFAIFDRSVKNTLVKCNVDPARVQRGKIHTAKMVVEDICGNVATYTKTFKW